MKALFVQPPTPKSLIQESMKLEIPFVGVEDVNNVKNVLPPMRMLI